MFSGLLTAVFRRGDVACRFGGDEFLVLLPGASAASAQERAERLRQAFADLRRAKSLPEACQECTLSIGVTELRNRKETAEALLRRADEALYAAKQQGRDRSVLLP
jgi:diguanylate cyclase (GGDEF)-like protein